LQTIDGTCQDMNKALGVIVGVASMNSGLHLERAEILATKICSALHDASENFHPTEIALASMVLILEAAEIISARCDWNTRHRLHALTHDGWRIIVRNGANGILRDGTHPLSIFALISGVMNTIANSKDKERAEAIFSDTTLSDQIIQEKLVDAQNIGHLVSTIVDLMAFAAHVVRENAKEDNINIEAIVDKGIQCIADWVGGVDEPSDKDGK
jgi:hypothetical protein